LIIMRRLLMDIPQAVVLDIGANVGHHSVALADLASAVHAFEPYPPRLAALKTNVARNTHLPIAIHPIALGCKDQEAPFRLPVTGEWTGVQFDPHGTLRFPMRNADAYLRDNHIDRVDMIKLDVDGNELDILRGLTDCIHRCRPIIIVEADETVDEFRVAIPQGYRFFGNSRRLISARTTFAEITRDFTGNVFCMPT